MVAVKDLETGKERLGRQQRGRRVTRSKKEKRRVTRSRIEKKKRRVTHPLLIDCKFMFIGRI